MSDVSAEFGRELRSERERRGISLEMLCGATKVNARHLQALEEGDYKALPGGVFRRGIVRAYLAAAGLEETEWMARFQQSYIALLGAGATDGAEDGWATFALNVKKNRGLKRDGTALRWLGVLALLLILVAAGWAVYRFVLAGRLSR